MLPLLQRLNTTATAIAMQDCVRIYDMLNKLPNMMEALRAYEGKYTDLMNEMFIQPLEVCVLRCIFRMPLLRL